MKNNLLEINFLKKIIEECNKQILQLREQIKSENYKDSKKIVFKKKISSIIKKRKIIKNKFNNLLK